MIMLEHNFIIMTIVYIKFYEEFHEQVVTMREDKKINLRASFLHHITLSPGYHNLQSIDFI